MHEHVRRRLDLGFLRRAVLSQASRPEALGPALRRCCEHILEQPASLTAFLETLDATALEGGITCAPRAFTALSEAFAMFAGPHARPRGSASSSTRAALPLHKLDVAVNLSALVKALAHMRSAVLLTPTEDGGGGERSPSNEQLISLAEAYEAAASACVAACVATAAVDSTMGEAAPSVGAWATVCAPARVDLAGGWTDTPPICYDVGGRVVNLAILVNGCQPIGARSRRIAARLIRITARDGSEAVVLRRLADLADRSNPLARGALVKAVLVTLGVVDPDSSQDLPSQLDAAGGGLEIELWSELPHGSGLGTSSILAAALVVSVGAAALNVRFGATALAHAVLRVEQCLTTGGGWQDQLGGCVGGAKLCLCPASLPLEVSCEKLALSAEAVSALGAHLQLLYTGVTRLAKNLLQDVLRRWMLGRRASADTIAGLVNTSHDMARALAAADMRAAGGALAAYWEQKKSMCDAEPPAVARVLRTLYGRRLIYGAALAGAGGGGFLVMVTVEPHARQAVEAAVLDEIRDSDEQMVFYDVGVDERGLNLSFEEPHDGIN